MTQNVKSNGNIRVEGISNKIQNNAGTHVLCLHQWEPSLLLSGVTILLSLTVFLNMVSETMPVTSDNPLLGTALRGTVSRQPFGS